MVKLMIICVVLCFISCILSAPASKYDFPDYSNIVFDEIQVETNEKSLNSKEWFETIDECIKKCIESNDVDKGFKHKSDCLQRLCEFY